MSTLAGKTLFITGASRGIGLAIALRAARDGANIVIAAKSAVANPKLPGTIHTAAAEIEAAGGKALALRPERPSILVGSTSWSTTPAQSGWRARRRRR